MSFEEKFEEEFTCAVCSDLCYCAATVTPCMHTFCGGCISKSYAIKTECPLCTVSIDQINPNRTIDTLIKVLLEKFPEKEKCKRDKEELDSKNTVKNGVVLKNTRIVDLESDENEEENDDNEEDDEGFTVVPVPAPSTGVARPVVLPIMPSILPAAVAVNDSDIQLFVGVTGTDVATARRLIEGAIARNLQPPLEHAMSYFYQLQQA